MPILRGAPAPARRRRAPTPPRRRCDTPGCRMLEAGDAAQRRSLAAARRTEQHHDLARRDVEAYAVDRRAGR